MCGLAGIVDSRGAESRDLVAMADVLYHRGPDGEGYAVLDAESEMRLMSREALSGHVHAGLGHRRLTIIAPTDDSAQPMRDTTGRFVLGYNGELYNYVELRGELERGVPLRGIEPGEHDVQRLIDWHFLKCFANEDFSPNLNDLVNFDRYHPPYASRDTEEGVRGWCDELGLRVEHLDSSDAGISVRTVVERA